MTTRPTITRRALAKGATGLAIASGLGASLIGSARAQSRLTLGVVGFQMSSETHARVVNAARDAARALGWEVSLQNSRGDMPTHVAQVENMIQARVGGIVIAMGKPVELDALLKRAREASIPVITVMSGTSPHTAFDIQVNEYAVGADSALYLLGLMSYRGNLLVQRFEGNVGTRIRAKVLDAVLSENSAVKVLGSHTMARTGAWRDDVRAGMSALLLRHGREVNGIWASFDGQAYVIDDILQQAGRKKGEVHLVSIDGGPETYRRIAAPESLLEATVRIPFEDMGKAAVAAMERIAVKREAASAIVRGPYLWMPAQLVDASNVRQYLPG